MYINLPFKTLGIKHTKKVDIVFNLGTLEDICKDANIEFYEVGDYIKSNGVMFSMLLMYHGYMAGCKYNKVKPKYTMEHVKIWVNNITAMEQAKILTLIEGMFDIMNNTKADSKKKA